MDSQELRLRGDIATLFSKVAESFQAPSASELENLKLLEERYSQASEEFNSIMKKRVVKMEKYMSTKGIPPFQLISYQQFVSE